MTATSIQNTSSNSLPTVRMPAVPQGTDQQIDLAQLKMPSVAPSISRGQASEAPLEMASMVMPKKQESPALETIGETFKKDLSQAQTFFDLKKSESGFVKNFKMIFKFLLDLVRK